MEIGIDRNRISRRKEQLSFFDEDPTEDGLTSNRLKQAIERNRAKRSKRAPSSLKQERRTPRLPGSSPARAEGKVSSRSQALSRLREGNVTRKRVARQEDAVFTNPLKKERRLPAGRVDYLESGTLKNGANKKRGLASRLKSLDSVNKSIDRKESSAKWSSIFAKLCWAICFVAILRLLISDGGVADYYSRMEDYNMLAQEHLDIMSENSAVRKNIDRIKFDHSYQKKLVRKHLSYISNDEYLILFAKKTTSRPI